MHELLIQESPKLKHTIQDARKILYELEGEGLIFRRTSKANKETSWILKGG